MKARLLFRNALLVLALLAALVFATSSAGQSIPTSTFSGLPASPSSGDLAFITDSGGTETVGSAAAGGGANRALVAYDGTQSRWEFLQGLPPAAAAGPIEIALSASQVGFTNAISGLSAVNVQAALEEISARGAAGGGGTWDFVPDPSSDTQGLQQLITAACLASQPIVIEFGEGTTTIDYTGFSGTDLSDGIIDFPENCEKVTLRGQGKQVSILNFDYYLDSTDASAADVTDLKVFRLRGNRWIKFENMTFAARNACNRSYEDGDAATTPNYPSTETCISDGRILFSIEAAADGTPSRNVDFDNVHLHFPGTYIIAGGVFFGEDPNVVRAVDSEEIHIRNSIIHGNGILVLIDDCQGCTVNYNWFGSAFPLIEGPHGVWMSGTSPFSQANAAQTDADYTREMQAAIALGVGEGKEAIGNRIDKAQLSFSNMQSRSSNATSAIAMASVIDLNGEVPRGAIVKDNTIYNVMDRGTGGLYFINYNAAIVTGNSMTCADLVDPSDCEGGSIIRFIDQALDLPSEAYNRENVFIGNMAMVFPTGYKSNSAEPVTPQDRASCITIHPPSTAANLAYGADTVNADNTFIGNVCDTDNTMFFWGKTDNSSAHLQHWGPGNMDISTGVEYSPGSTTLTQDRALKTSEICHGGLIQNGLAPSDITVTLPEISENMGGHGCAIRATNLGQNGNLKICAANSYFRVRNDASQVGANHGNRCIESDAFGEWVEATVVRGETMLITAISNPGTTTTISFINGQTPFHDGDRIMILDIPITTSPIGEVSLNNREFIVDNISYNVGGGVTDTFDLLELDGVTAFDSSGFRTYVSGGKIVRYDWLITNEVAGSPWLSTAP